MDNSYYSSQCEAIKYGDCLGFTENVDVTFKYRDKKGCHIPDEIVKVSLCHTHQCWLNSINDNKPLEMRGEDIDEALYCDLFSPFENKKRIYTLVKLESNKNDDDDNDGNDGNDKYFLINSRDFIKFKNMLIKSMLEEDKKKIWILDEGFFQTFIKLVYNDENKTKYHTIDDIVEIKYIYGELCLEALTEKLITYYKPVENGKMVRISEFANAWIERKEENPTLETEYTIEPIPDFIRSYFIEKQKKEQYGEFEECIYFIESEIEINIINWELLRKNSSHTDRGVFNSFQKLTNALIENNEFTDSIITEMNLSGDITEDVLWITYIMSNHYLYMSRNSKKKLTENTKLIDLFIEKGLEKNLLTLAISGERIRFLSIKRRDHYDILNENEFVVEYLVPKYIKSNTIIYKSNGDCDDNGDDNVSLTPLEYWHYFSNTTTYIGGGFCIGRNNDETFEKNEKIREYLEKHN